MKITINTTKSPSPIGPYSQATQNQGLLFVSGQIGLDPTNNQLIQGEIELETTQVMKNIQGILEAAGYDWSHVMKSSIFLKDMNDFKRINEVYASFLAAPYPARETVQVSKLPMDVRVEISVIAYKNAIL